MELNKCRQDNALERSYIISLPSTDAIRFIPGPIRSPLVPIKTSYETFTTSGNGFTAIENLFSVFAFLFAY